MCRPVRARAGPALILAAAALIASCASVPFDYPKQTSVAITDTDHTRLGETVSHWVSVHGGLSGFYPLAGGMDALGVRLRLLEMAEESVDLQYFLMKDDAAGQLFAAELLAAADRGVRIRFLLDDVFTTFEDDNLALLDQHENIEIRLYNPVARGGIWTINFLTDFKRANRRMHNKSFTADNQVTVVGGRNIADEYFELRNDAEFIDFDVVGIGSVAADVGRQFDDFWNNERSVPIAAFSRRRSAEAYASWRAGVESRFAQAHESTWSEAVNSQLASDLFDGVVAMYPADYAVVTDDPAKLENRIDESRQALVNYLSVLAEDAKSEIIIVTPYFVPLEPGVEFWRRITDKGVRVLVITNSLASNNHTAVHSGYASYRKDIIKAGVELYEARVDAVAGSGDTPEGLTLHSKVVAIDGSKLFVGSLNLDPRSIDINAEMGVVIESSELVADLRSAFLEELPTFAYRVRLDDRGALTWHSVVAGKPVVDTSEPRAGAWLKFKAFLLKIVPDSQL